MRKRKLTDADDDADYDSTPVLPYASRNIPHSKRRRFDLARNLSQLSLFEQAQAQAQVPIIEEYQTTPLPSTVTDKEVNISPWFPDPQGVSEDTTMDTNGEISTIRPIIEEPIEHAITIPDIRMRHTSSYEPEKDRKLPSIPHLPLYINEALIKHPPSGIVVTDLDSSEDEADTPPETSSDDQYSVSHALLSRINEAKASASLIKDIPPTPQSDPSQALVLFRPSPWSAKDPRELEGIYRARDEDKHHIDQTDPQTEDTDAMDIE